MQADAEHQENNPHLGQLADGFWIAVITRRERPDGDPGQQKTDYRRQADALEDQTPDKSRAQSHGDVFQQTDIMHGDG